MQWIAVDSEGHVPGIAAILPTGYEVLLDGNNCIADMHPVAQAQQDTAGPTQPLQGVNEDVQVVE